MPITNRQCPEDLVGYLAVSWPTSAIDVPVLILQIVLVAKRTESHKYFGTVKMSDVFESFGASEEIENNRPHDP